MNTLCNARIPNNNPNSPIGYFILMTVREYSDEFGGTYIDEIRNSTEYLFYKDKSVDEPFYRIYGEKRIDDMTSKLVLLAEFYNINHAKQFLYYITGEQPSIISY